MHDRFRPARSTAALAAAIALAALVGNGAAAPIFATPARANPANQSALIVPQSAETILGEIQQQLAIVMGKTEAPLEHVDALSRALLAAHGGAKDRAVVGDLAKAVANVIARGSLSGELLERLAQNLYAAASPRQLTPSEARLLALDVAMLLHESGGSQDDVTLVLARLDRLCPGASIPGGKLPKTAIDDEVHRPAPRVLSVLTRPSSGS
jgi:hypothetical protein